MKIISSSLSIVLIVIPGYAIFHNQFRINLSRAYRIASVSVPPLFSFLRFPPFRREGNVIRLFRDTNPFFDHHSDCIFFLSDICQDNSAHFPPISFRGPILDGIPILASSNPKHVLVHEYGHDTCCFINYC